jgi:hypothetical protein
MCDICRERDRQNRKNKKLRDLGQLPPIRFQTNIGNLKKGGKLKPISSKEAVVASTGTYKGASSSLDPAASTSPDESSRSVQSTSSNEADEISADLLHRGGPAYNVSLL